MKLTSKINVLLIIVLLFNKSIIAQTSILNDWKIDTLNTKNIKKANSSRNDWIFNFNKTSIKIIKNKYRRKKGDSLPFSEKEIKLKFKNRIGDRRFVKKVRNGYLIGVNNGEFGGGLYFVSKNGKKSYTIAPYIKVRKIFKYNSNIYVSSGLAHLGGNYGKISELKIKKGKWKLINSTKLIGQPTLTFLHNDLVYIITSQYVLKLNKEMSEYVQVLKAPVYWGVLYPSSTFVSKKDLFISMRKGIMKIKNFETSPRYEWYTPNDDNDVPYWDDGGE
jgi:hypothetical protein